MHTLGPFTHVDDPTTRRTRRGQMQVRELRNGVPQAVVEITRCDIAPVDVSNQSAGGYRGQRTRHRLDTVTEHNDDIRPGLFEKPCDARNPAGQAYRLIQRIVVTGLHLHPRIYRPAAANDLVNRATELAQKVHSGCNHLELQMTVLFDRLHGGLQEPVLGPSTGDHSDAANAPAMRG